MQNSQCRIFYAVCAFARTDRVNGVLNSEGCRGANRVKA